VYRATTGEELWTPKIPYNLTGVTMLDNGSAFVAACDDGKLRCWSRRRPEYAWGVVVLPEFWLALISGSALLYIATCRFCRLFADARSR